MKQAFKSVNFRESSRKIIDQCNKIVDDYLEQDLRLTLRQLYYQCIVRNLFPNVERSYKNLGNLISDARLAGLMDWDAIEDRVRQPRKASEWDNVADLVESALDAYRLPRWKGQDTYAELWVEKDALAGVLEPLAWEFHVTLMVNRGYSSQSAMYEAARRFMKGRNQAESDFYDENEPEKDAVLFYLGDHDPSGEDMVRDVRDRLEMFGLQSLTVQKIALTMDQVRQYNPPPNPAKMSDSRAVGYVEKYGRSSWEVDALPPEVLTKIVRTSFRSIVNKELMDVVKAREERDKDRLREAAAEINEGNES